MKPENNYSNPKKQKEKNIKNDSKKKDLLIAIEAWTKDPLELRDVLLGLFAFASAVLSNILVFYLISDSVSYLSAQILTLVIVLITSWGFYRIKEGDSHFGKAFVPFVFVVFLFNVTTHSYTEKQTENDQAIIQQSQVPLVANNVFEATSPGSFKLGILKNQKKLVKLPKCSHYNFNKTATLIVETKDGQIVNSWEPGNWPLASELLVTNLSDTTITLFVTQ